jgi:hypothetical protein
MDVFTFKPPRHKSADQIWSSSRATQEYAALVDSVLERTGDGS